MVFSSLKKLFFRNKESSDDLSELRGAISQYQGEEIEEEKEMLESVLDLAKIEVYDVMNHRKNLFSVDVDLPIKKIIDKVKDCPFSRIPLYKNHPDNIVGIIRVKTAVKQNIVPFALKQRHCKRRVDCLILHIFKIKGDPCGKLCVITSF